jgi:iron complex outermembrane receptor protein
MRYTSRVSLCAATAIFALTASQCAFAADDVATGGEASSQSDEIIVTAQKRSESVQDVPATVTVIGGQRLDRYALGSAMDVAKFAPNVTGWSNDGRSRPRYYIRGIGNGNISNNAVGAVGVYSDEVYLNSLVLQGFPLFDLERVEVLNGPQGTLQGKNSTAGSINFISRKPSFETGGYAKVSLGDYGQKQFEAAAGGPIIGDNVAVRASARLEKQGGFATNLFNGDSEGDFTDFGARVQLLAKVGDGAGDLLANVHYRKFDGSRAPYQLSVQPQGAPLPHMDRDVTNTNLGFPQKVDASGASLKINAYLPGDMTLTSISGYEKGDRLEIVDADAGPRELSRTYSKTKPEQFSQELRLASSSENRLTWITGLYYFHETLRSFYVQATLNAATGGVPGYFTTAYTQKTDSFAVFGNARYALTDRLHIQGGLRWTSDRSKINLVSQRAVAPISFVDTDNWWLPSATGQTLVDIARQNQKQSWKKLNYDAEIQFDVMPDAKLYGRIANGYRAGNFQGQVAPTVAPGLVDPETLTAYEIGLKSGWLDDRLIFNANLFYSKYKDIQVSVVRPAPTGIAASLANAAAGYSKGAEVELRARPVEPLTLTANIGLLRTKFTSFTITNAFANIDGNQFARAPKTTGFIAADYTVPLSFGQVILGTSWRYNSHFYYLITDQTSPALQQNGYAVGDVRLTYISPDENLEITAGVYNVANKRYKTQVLPYQFASYAYSFGAPRTFLISVKATF